MKRREILGGALGSGLASLGAPGWAQSAAEPPSYPTPPEPGPPRPLALAAPQETVLANGLRVVVATRPGVPLVTAELLALAGAETDPDALPGIASFAASLMSQGTARHRAPALAAAAESLGSSLDASAAWGESILTMTVTTPRLDAALGLLAEVARTPTFAPAEIERVRSQLLDSIKVRYAEARWIAAWASQRLAYGAGAWGHPAVGTPASIAAFRRADAVAAHGRIWRPDRAVLVLAGDIDLARATALAERHLGRWHAPPALPFAVPPPVAAPGAGPLVIDMPGAGQAAVLATVALPARTLDELAVAAVLNAVLGGGYSSRLGSEIRIKRGLSYDASSAIASRRAHGLLQATAQTKNETAAEVVQLIDGQLDALAASAVPPDELQARKATLIGAWSRSVETTAGLAAALRGLLVMGLPPATLSSRIAAYGRVGAVDVQRYAARTLGPAQRQLVIAGDARAFAANLGAALPAARGPLQTVPLERLVLTRAEGVARP